MDIEYIELDEDKFKDKVKHIVTKYLDQHNYLVAKSNLYYKNLGYEPEDAKKELDNQYYNLLDDLSDEINDCYYEFQLNSKNKSN